MGDISLVEILETLFEMEISNRVEYSNDKVVVYFKNGTKAKIKINNVA